MLFSNNSITEASEIRIEPTEIDISRQNNLRHRNGTAYCIFE